MTTAVSARPSPVGEAAELRVAELCAMADKPVLFSDRVLGLRLWSAQRAILNALVEYERVAVRSCNAAGKTLTAAAAALYWLYCLAPSIVLSTAPTWRQVEKLLWAEINKLHARAKPRIGRCLTTELKIDHDWYALGLSTDEPDRFQGFHAENLLVIVDEACGVKEPIFAAIEGILSTGAEALGAEGKMRLLLIGNPTSPIGTFWKAFQPGSGYYTMHISAFDTPQFTGEFAEVPGFGAHFVKLNWPEDRRKAWGENSPHYIERVLGEFAGGSEDAVIAPVIWTEAARNRMPRPEDIGDSVQMGVDVARFGGNRSAVAWRSGRILLGVESKEGASVSEVAGWTIHKARALLVEHDKPVTVVVDETGVGGGVLDLCRADEGEGVHYQGVHFGSAARDPEEHKMAKDEMFWDLRQLLQPGTGTDDMVWAAVGDAADRASGQLAEIRFGYDLRGRVTVEAKEEMAKRGMPSPDEADAVAMAFWQRVAPRQIVWGSLAPAPLVAETILQQTERLTGGASPGPQEVAPVTPDMFVNPPPPTPAPAKWRKEPKQQGQGRESPGIRVVSEGTNPLAQAGLPSVEELARLGINADGEVIT